MAVMTQSSGNFQKLVGLYENPLIEYWQDVFADTGKDGIMDMLFTKEQSSNPTEAISEQVGGPEFKEWNGEYTYGEVKDGDTKVWTPIIWQAGMAYDRFLLSNAKLLNLKNQQGRFAMRAARLRQWLAGDIFTYADQTAGFTRNGVTLTWNLSANGLPLGSDSQTSANYSTTQDNLTANVLNETNVETACQAIFDRKDEDGEFASLNPDCLIVPTASRKTALEIIGGEGKVDVDDNNPNIYHGSMKLIVWKYFRKQSTKSAQPWVVCDFEAAKQSLKNINRLESGDAYDLKSWKDEETETWKFGSLMWFSMGGYSWRPFQFNIPA